jgi:hypothetical protein
LDCSLSQFPFIAICLQLGIGYNQADGSENAVRKEPLGTVYYDNTLEYGMVVIDISDLYEIRYGFIGFGIHKCSRFSERPHFPPTLEGHQPRQPLSAKKFMTRCIMRSYHLTSSGGFEAINFLTSCKGGQLAYAIQG